MISSYEKGVRAENLACSFLTKKGYLFHHRRYKTPYGEIDLVMTYEGTLVFVEVKQRKTFDAALTSVTDRQKGRIRNAALFFLQHNPTKISYGAICFDGVFFQNRQKILHLRNIF